MKRRLISACIILPIFVSAYLFFNSGCAYAAKSKQRPSPPASIVKGVWVTCFSQAKPLYSKEAAASLIKFCKKAGINQIYLQLYRADQAFYDSKVTDRTKYEGILASSGLDTIEFLLKEAQKSDIKVFAWVNCLNIGVNKKANIILKFGDSVTTRDQYLRPSMRGEETNETDSYYLRDEQLFLEPGDPRVAEYISSIVSEIITRYPLISGVHLDYVRYPHPIPYIPDTRFKDYGLSYGYGRESIARFKEETGINPLTLRNEKKEILMWDNWKRGQVTNLIEKISSDVKRKSKNLAVSCAVMPSPEYAYCIGYQDWPYWLEQGIVDYVVLMNYTKDTRLASERVKSAIAYRDSGRIFVGIGAFLMKDEQALFTEQCKTVKSLKPDGIVFFSYDDIYDKADLLDF